MLKARNDAGQALVVVALAMIVILGFLGLGIDLGYLRYMKRQLQKVADAAALAGAMELSYCGGTSNCSALTAAAQDALTENGFTSSTLVKSCGTGTGNLTITVNNPPCYLGSADPHNGDAHYVEVVVSQVEPLMFAKLLGVRNATITARAEAALGSSSTCMVALNPTGQAAINVNNGATLNLSSCGMYVDSSSATAVSVTGGATLRATTINIVGNYTANNGGTISPTPNTGVAAVSDPLSYLPPPPGGPPYTCAHTNFTASDQNETLQPGVYCGGITIGNNSNVTFAAGTYVIAGGGLCVGCNGGGGSVTGTTGVTFFLTGTAQYPYGPVTVENGMSPNLVAPTSGTYAGILFYQDPNAVCPSSGCASSLFTGGTSSLLQGALYFPTTSMTFSNGSSAQYTIIVAQTITVNGGSTATLNSNYSSLPGGSPLKGTNAALGE